MTEHYSDDRVIVYQGDCREVMATLDDECIDAIVCDPPYELKFMSKGWDGTGVAFDPSTWKECLRVLKPGGHLLAFGGSRTWHRMAVAIEDAGFEMRDSIAWLYGSGFPKSMDVSKAIDKQRDDNPDRKAVGAWLRAQREAQGRTQKEIATNWPSVTGGITGCVANWEGGFNCPTWDQWLRLKALLSLPDEMDAEVWRLNGRKGTPGEAWAYREVVGERTTGRGTGRGSVAYIGDSENRDITAPATDAAKQWEGWGTALKPAFEPIVVARKPLGGKTVAANVLEHGTGALNIDACRVGIDDAERQVIDNRSGAGFNADAYGEGMGRASGVFKSAPGGRWPTNVLLDGEMADQLDEPAKFFPTFRYQAKAPAKERPKVDGVAHPTVKPLELMRWLIRLVTPPEGVLLDPFAGSGTTLEAAMIEGVLAIGIEFDPAHLPLIMHRIDRQVTTDRQTPTTEETTT